MLKKQEIIELIKENRTPCWTVASIKSKYAKDKDFKGSYNNEPGETEDASIEKSIAKLELLLSFLTNEICDHYEITLKPTPKSNGSNVLTYHFILNDNQNKEIDNKTNVLNGIDPNNLSALGFVPLGMLEVERERTKLAMEGMEQRFDIKYREQRILDREQELKEKENYYNSNVNKLADVAQKTMPGILEGIFGIITKKDTPTLTGNTTVEKIGEPENPNESIIERIALNINQTFHNEKDLLKLEEIINNIINKVKNPVKNDISEENKPVESSNNIAAPTE